jgi:hypothetical protein
LPGLRHPYFQLLRLLLLLMMMLLLLLLLYSRRIPSR